MFQFSLSPATPGIYIFVVFAVRLIGSIFLYPQPEAVSLFVLCSCFQPEILGPESDLRSSPLYCLIFVSTSSHSLAITRDTQAVMVKKEELRTDRPVQYLDHWAIERTSAQPQIKLSLLRSHS
jgi:hypothetical protein